MNHADDLKRLYDYGYYANKKLLAVVATLRPDQFIKEVAGSYGSVRNTLVHTASADWGWIDRCGGPPRGEKLNAGDFRTVESVLELFERIETISREFVSALHDSDMSRAIEFSLPGGPSQTISLGHLMQHAAVHAVHHRGQVALLLRMLGVVPGNFDYLFFEP